MNKKYITKAERSEFSLSQNLQDILVGLLLGDLYMQRRSNLTLSVRLTFCQGLVHKDYLMHLYELFKTYGAMSPQIYNGAPDKRTGKTYNYIRFNTYSLFCFNDLYNIFYPLGKKVIPHNIAELLTPLGLCYWICDDGCFDKTSRAVILCTESFTIEEVNLLASVLVDKFHLKCAVNKRTNGFRIRISAKALPELQRLLGPHMPPMMLHKIGVGL